MYPTVYYIFKAQVILAEMSKTSRFSSLTHKKRWVKNTQRLSSLD
ncbi:hypothetical protein M917_2838 [Psychrobacter aquaticus CMS 56]|uniref:Uncharacterized protein n=1 Tax=Psychrobacter aquaticus CMS 56 TaxID=1354303 RepID=U4T2X7_9GAMM|nr:hypothetical protein M917_2838 [Psychrobacter aquaticus CMS 56]